MRLGIRIGSSVAAVAALGTVLTAAAGGAPAAYAGGKSGAGCSPPYYLGSITTGGSTTIGDPGFSIYDYTLKYIPNFDTAALSSLLAQLDHNNDDLLCYKLPPGWPGPPYYNASAKYGLLNLVDDKILPTS